ncbi:hypothetical protein QBC44DRAFT_329157 [Cladorrhinum sp. PSN332]|nr:hypothetical protein QBC44DRAFT_329157 [Cladorrhinum sp. PSN332]
MTNDTAINPASLRNRGSHHQRNDSLGEYGTNDERGDFTKQQQQQQSRDAGGAAALLTEVAKDSVKLTRGTLWLLAGSYPLWKYLLLLYVIWLFLSNLLVQLTAAVSKGVTKTLCPIPFVGSSIPLCAASPRGARVISASKVVKSQEELSKVMDTVGRGFDLARDMVGHEFAVRDLRIRVSASTLPRREELSKELQTLVRQTKEAARGLSRFTAKVGKSVDMAKTFDHHAIKALEDVARWERKHNLLTISGRALSAIRPFGAFDRRGSTEERVKDIFLVTAERIGDKVKLLIQESFHLSHSLESIHETLDSIKEIAVGELGDLPQQNVLSALWMLLARPDDHAKLKSHKTLLVDMTEFYKNSSSVMEKTSAALNRIDAELGEFRDDFATPGLILRNNSLGVIIDMLRMSAARLEAGNLNLRRIEEGGRPQRLGGEPITAATVVGNLV